MRLSGRHTAGRMKGDNVTFARRNICNRQLQVGKEDEVDFSRGYSAGCERLFCGAAIVYSKSIVEIN
jgi:hypothetical protein